MFSTPPKRLAGAVLVGPSKMPAHAGVAPTASELALPRAPGAAAAAVLAVAGAGALEMVKCSAPPGVVECSAPPVESSTWLADASNSSADEALGGTAVVPLVHSAELRAITRSALGKAVCSATLLGILAANGNSAMAAGAGAAKRTGCDADGAAASAWDPAMDPDAAIIVASGMAAGTAVADGKPCMGTGNADGICTGTAIGIEERPPAEPINGCACSAPPLETPSATSALVTEATDCRRLSALSHSMGNSTFCAAQRPERECSQ